MRSSSGRRKTESLATVLCCAALGLGNGDAALPSATDEILAATQARYEAVRDLHADFVQTSHIASLDRKEVSRGKVWVLRPGRMRWEYEQPEARVITVDGDTLRLYTPADGQLQIASLDAGTFSPTALDFLLGTGDLRETFRAERLPDGEGGELRLKLLPEREARFQHLELRVAPGTHQLRGSVLVDVLGNRTEVGFEGVVENAGVAEERFTISVPEGTEIIDLR